MNLKNFIPFYKSYVKAMSRVSALEMAFAESLRNPKYEDSTEAGFNAQVHRKQIFQDLINRISFQAIYETGTYFGNTSGYMKLHSSCPVITCEASPIFRSLAMSRLRDIEGIEFHCGDSREFLRARLGSLNAAEISEVFFFYLDAHWHDDLPLEEEIDIISSKLKNSVILIDDFAVPGDPGYSYDDYGRGKSLELQTFEKCFKRHGAAIFFPSLPSTQETGGKRGCVLLSTNEVMTKKIREIPSLKEYCA